MSTSVASVVSHFPDAENGFTTTTAGSVASGAATVTLNSVAGYTNGQPVVLIIDPTDVSKKQTFTGIIDTSGVQVTSVVWTAGTNTTHALGATVVDYATATHIAMISKGIQIDHLQTGRHIVANNYDPSNTTLETQKWTGVASAVNEPNTTNAITGNAVRYGASGGDSNIDTYVTGKGTGSGRFAGVHDGWVACDETLTYASASTFTCSATLAANLSTGDKIKLTQTTAKYFYVVSVSGTTITVTGGTDYTLANAAITLPFYSKEATPVGFPGEFAYTPTWTNVTIGNATVNAKFSMVLKKVFCRLDVVWGSGTSASGTFQFTLPVTAATYAQGAHTLIGTAWAGDTGTQDYKLSFGLVTDGASGTKAQILVEVADATYVKLAPTGASAPHVWATTDIIGGEFEYMVA